MFSLSIVIGSYQAIELLGVAARKAANPQEAIVKSVKTIIWRIVIFYVGAIFVIVTIYPWDKLSAIGSPFVEIFAKLGIIGAASIINFVIITAVLSVANSAKYSSSRMLYKLSVDKDVSAKFSRLSKNKVPSIAIVAITLGILFGFILDIIATTINKSIVAFSLLYIALVFCQEMYFFKNKKLHRLRN